MIIKEPHAMYSYENVTYIIGDFIVGTPESEYEGLYGVITEIRDGNDQETENETPDIYCRFEAPVLPYDIEELGKRFSELYQCPKKLEDISLDSVIMAPSMIVPLQPFHGNKQVTLYIIHEDWAVDGEYDYCVTPFMDYQSAKFNLCQKLTEEKQCGCISVWEDNEDLIVNTDKDFYECYQNDRYFENHYKIFLDTNTISLYVPEN
ncbi:hypothetical protein LI221_16385 [Faecalimonas umbilicata]|nr:hypothetical protein [Faecalimonas umbilicata]